MTDDDMLELINEATEKTPPDTSEQLPPVANFKNFRETLSAEKRLLVTDIARQYGLHDSDPLWAIIAALGHVENFAGELPEQIDRAANQALDKIEVKIGSMEKIVEGIATRADEARSSIKSAAEAGAVAAVETTLKKFSHESSEVILELARETTVTIIGEAIKQLVTANDARWLAIKSVIEKHTTAQVEQKKTIFLRSGLVIAAGIMVISMTFSTIATYYLVRSPKTLMTAQLQSMTECAKNDSGDVVCQFKTPGRK